MLVEINLLPQKEPKKYSFIIILAGLLVLFILVGGYYFWQTQNIKDEITSLDNQISMTKKIAEKEQQNSETAASSNSVSQLKSAIEWASEYPLQTVPVMQHLTSLLPERGFIQSFAYTEAGTVTLTVQFDSAREAAYFLDSLHESNWIEEASLNSLSTTSQSESETNAATTTAASNSTTTSTNSTTSANQTTPATTTVDGQNTPTSGTTNQATQGSTAMATNQTNVTTTTTSATVKTSTNYLPRYTGQFEIKFNKEEIKKSTKSKKDGEGVKGS